MASPALGTKRICSGCEAKFYDLRKDPIVCPTCETVYVIPTPEPTRGGRSYSPRRAYDPKAETATPMGTRQEVGAPGAADEKQDATDDAEVVAIDDVEVEADGNAEAGGVPMLEELDEK